mgnify:CR=1 FL=1
MLSVALTEDSRSSSSRLDLVLWLYSVITQSHSLYLPFSLLSCPLYPSFFYFSRFLLFLSPSEARLSCFTLSHFSFLLHSTFHLSPSHSLMSSFPCSPSCPFLFSFPPSFPLSITHVFLPSFSLLPFHLPLSSQPPFTWSLTLSLTLSLPPSSLLSLHSSHPILSEAESIWLHGKMI